MRAAHRFTRTERPAPITVRGRSSCSGSPPKSHWEPATRRRIGPKTRQFHGQTGAAAEREAFGIAVAGLVPGHALRVDELVSRRVARRVGLSSEERCRRDDGQWTEAEEMANRQRAALNRAQIASDAEPAGVEGPAAAPQAESERRAREARRVRRKCR